MTEIRKKKTGKTKPEPKEPAVVPVKAITSFRHDGRRIRYGTIVKSDDPIVAQFPNYFVDVKDKG